MFCFHSFRHWLANIIVANSSIYACRLFGQFVPFQLFFASRSLFSVCILFFGQRSGKNNCLGVICSFHDCSGLFSIILDYSRLLSITLDYSRLLSITLDYSRLASRLLSIIFDYSRLLSVISSITLDYCWLIPPIFWWFSITFRLFWSCATVTAHILLKEGSVEGLATSKTFSQLAKHAKVALIEWVSFRACHVLYCSAVFLMATTWSNPASATTLMNPLMEPFVFPNSLCLSHFPLQRARDWHLLCCFPRFAFFVSWTC